MKSFIFSILAVSFANSAQALEPFKDDMWSHKKRQILEERDRGAYKRYRWREIEDVNGRDIKPGVEAKPERIDQEAVKQTKAVKIAYSGGEIDTYEVGNVKGAKFATVFIHGSGGDKELGGSDIRFGGNFNRMKSLAVRNGGVYYSPSVELPTSSAQDMVELVKHIQKNSPGAKVIFVCGSAGASTCWNMARNSETAKHLGGLYFVGGAGMDPQFEQTDAFHAKVPVILSHGSKDPVVPIDSIEQKFNSIRKADPNYPVRMEVFEGGKHGTPLRSTDYKESFEWMLSRTTKDGSAATAPGFASGKPPAAPAPKADQ
jgi:pimeloyl-ACP methyl ester carboxylesterase